jgi:hypothetical protein
MSNNYLTHYSIPLAFLFHVFLVKVQEKLLSFGFCMLNTCKVPWVVGFKLTAIVPGM